MLRFENCTFNATGLNQKDKTFGLVLTGDEDIYINDCIFNGTGYAGILNNSNAKVFISRTIFNCDNLYNPIEGTQEQNINNDNVEITNCMFVGHPGNNFINFYKVKSGSKHIIDNCSFAGQCNNNILRLSNINNAIAEFNILNSEYIYTGGAEDEYTGCVFLQDYTNKSGNKQNFANYTLKFKNLTKPSVGSLYYVYEDGIGIITNNNPIIVQE